MVEKLPINELVRAYRSRALSPVEVVREHLHRIEEFGAPINAFVYVESELALEAARESESRYKKGEAIGPLDGVSFSAKDTFSITGRPSRRGSKATPTTPATITSPAVARCLEAGAIFVGATTMPEFGVGPLTISPLTGVTTNPWDNSRHAGGSSGGAAAAVAAGFNTFSFGTDAGGSNRIPAALTGTVGFKPSGGRVPSFPVTGAGSLSCPGPIASNVADIATIMHVVARYDARDINALPPDDVDYEAELSGDMNGLRFAYSATLGFAKLVDPEIADRARSVALWLADAGFQVDEADPELEDPVSWYVSLLHAGNQFALRKLTDSQKLVLSPQIRAIVDAPPIAIESYFEAQQRSNALALAMNKFHERYDFLITPAVAAPAFSIERVCPPEFDQFTNKRSWTPFVSAFNLTKQPAISIPIGLTGAGLPIGLQIVSPRFEDAKLLRIASFIAGNWKLNDDPDLKRGLAAGREAVGTR